MIPKVKIMVWGDGNVGQTSLINRFLYGRFNENEKPENVNPKNPVRKTIKIGKMEICLEIVDEQPDVESASPEFVGMKAIIALYDMTNPETLENIRTFFCNK